MNESLMKHVERAVRSLRAGRQRKLQMREELLAHLTAIYEEELAADGDETAALAAATARLGDSAELARELAGSLGWRDRWSWINEGWAATIDRTLGWQEAESFARFALRSGAWIAGLNAAFAFVMIAVASVASNQLDPTFASLNRYTAVLFASLAVGVSTFLWAVQVTHRSLDRSQRGRRLVTASLNLLGWTALFVMLALAFWLGITLSFEAVLERLPRVSLFAAITMPALLLLMAWATQRAMIQNRRYERWTQLEIEDQ